MIGGAWIARAGLTPRAAPAAAVAAMQSVVPPWVPPDDDAAPLYRQAFGMIEADHALEAEDSPLRNLAAADIGSATVGDLLARHATTLTLLRRAADRPGCRFPRDWSRPSMDMLLPEAMPMRQAARLLALAARREAADGDGSEALGDFVRSVPLLQRHFLGEEAFGLATFAELADGTSNGSELLRRAIAVESAAGRAAVEPLRMLVTCFLLPADLRAYRSVMHRFQRLADDAAADTPYPEVTRQAAAIDKDLSERRQGIITTELAPALGGVMRSQARAQALHRSAEVLLAATKVRLKTGELPKSSEPLVPGFMIAIPRDPFLNEGPLIVKAGVDEWLVYSVGPDGEDDGGPVRPGAAVVQDNDDVGLRLERSR